MAFLTIASEGLVPFYGGQIRVESKGGTKKDIFQDQAIERWMADNWFVSTLKTGGDNRAVFMVP